MASRRPNPPSPLGASLSPGGGGGSGDSRGGGDVSRPPLTPLTSRSRTGSRDRDHYASGIFRTPQQQQQQQHHHRHGNSNGQHRGVVGVSSSGSGGTPRQRGAHHSNTSPPFGTPPPPPAAYRGSRHPVQHSRSYGSATSPDNLSPSSSLATPRRRGGVAPPFRRSPSSPADDSTSASDFDPYLEVPNLGHADHTVPLYYGANEQQQERGTGRAIRGLAPFYDSRGRTSSGENVVGGHRHPPPPHGNHQHASTGTTADSHHGTALCSRKRTRRRAAACAVVMGLIGAQYLYAIRVGSGADNAANSAVEAVAAAVSGAVNDLLGAASATANGGVGGSKSIGNAIAGIAGGLGGADGDVSGDTRPSIEDGDQEVRFTSQRSNATLAHQTQSRRKRVKREEQRKEVPIPRLLFVGSTRGKSASKKGEKGGPSLADLIDSVRRQQLSRAGKKQSNSTSSTTGALPSRHKIGRKVKLYPAEQTDKDETQMYPEIDSSDPPFNETMLVRSFPPRKGDYFIGSERDVGVGCHPMADWQATFHPTCNSVHDIDAGVAMKSDRLSFLGAGHWRGAWALRSTANNAHGFLREDAGRPVVYKTWSYEHRFEDFYYELNRIDAVAMERLTSSPYAINIYGLCGLSSMTQFATETLTSVADSLDSIDKLRLVRKIAKGLSHVHGIGGSNRHASLVHNDLNTAHILLDSDGKTPLIHDFNVAQLLLLSNKEKPCGFASEHWSPQWRSPEEIRSFQSIEHEMLTEKIDIYAFGNIIYRFLTGQRAWRLGTGSMTEEYQNDIAKWKSEEGKTPSVPERILKLRDEDKYVNTLLSLMDRCFAVSPDDRPSAKDIVRTIDRVLARG